MHCANTLGESLEHGRHLKTLALFTGMTHIMPGLYYHLWSTWLLRNLITEIFFDLDQYRRAWLWTFVLTVITDNGIVQKLQEALDWKNFVLGMQETINFCTLQWVAAYTDVKCIIIALPLTIFFSFFWLPLAPSFSIGVAGNAYN